MKQIFILSAVIAISLSACAAGHGIEVSDAWMRPAAEGENGAIYFVIHNRGSSADTLSGVSADIAEAVEMHESMMSGDVMQMQQLDTVSLEPFSEVKFEPGGLHVMLVDLKKDLKVGDTVDITLHFTNFEDIKITVLVRDTPENHSSSDH